MFPLSHIYVSTKVTGRQSPLLIFGSVLPDIATTSRNSIGRDKIHYAPNEFRQFVNSIFPELSDLAIGVDLHSHINQGADFYSDNSEIGFAYIFGRKMVRDVMSLLGIDDEPKSLVLAHNLIEAGVDINLNTDHSEVLTLWRNSLKEMDIKKVISCLSSYLSLPADQLESEINFFVDFLGPDSLISVETIVDRIALPLVSMRYGKVIDRNQTISILNTARDLTASDYMKLLDNAVSEITSHGKIKV